MTPDKIHTYRQRWRDMERRQRDLDYTRSQWAKDLRSEFPANTDGDNQFIKWCAQQINLGVAGARELLERAEAIQLVPEETAWTEYGGFPEIRRVLPLPKAHRVRVLAAAKTPDQTIRRMVRGLAPAISATKQSTTPSAKDDATRLAAYLVARKVPLTKSIQEIVDRYISREKLRSVA